MKLRILNSVIVYFLIIYIISNSKLLSLFLSIVFTLLFSKQKLLPLLLSYYLISSWIEWFLHKYLMHEFAANDHSHKIHHLLVVPNMNLIKKDELNATDFSWKMLFIITSVTFITSFYYFYKMYNIKPSVHFVTILGCIFLISMIWNNLHNAMHCQDLTSTIFYGPPSIISKETARSLPWFDTLYSHHYLHHVVKKPKGNFNIVLLGMDKLMGTEVDEQHEIYFNKCD
uniref:Fatty acid hydroxylase domain-containing protein n=1 Tax=viral metagenome TaxID=1070528 RepID=A0A6C0IXU8_9ZZZZ